MVGCEDIVGKTIIVKTKDGLFPSKVISCNGAMVNLEVLDWNGFPIYKKSYGMGNIEILEVLN